MKPHLVSAAPPPLPAELAALLLGIYSTVNFEHVQQVGKSPAGDVGTAPAELEAVGGPGPGAAAKQQKPTATTSRPPRTLLQSGAPHGRAVPGHPGTPGCGTPRECTWVAEDAGLSLLQPWHQSGILPGWCSQFQEQPVLSAGHRHLPFSMTNNRQKLPPLSQARSLPTR